MPSAALYTPSGYHRSWRALIAAKYSGFVIEEKPFVPGKTDTDTKFLAHFPPSTIPVFEHADKQVHLFDANAIAYYVGNEQLRGGKTEYLVSQWCNLADNGLLPSVATWVYPCLGVAQYNKQNTDNAKNAVASLLSFINQHLNTVTYLVGERITQADITMFSALYLLYTHVLDESLRRPYPHVNRWYTTIANQPEVVAVAGKVELCVKEAQFDAKKFAELHPKDAKAKEAKPQKAEAKKPKAQDDDDCDLAPPEEKKENLFELLPKGTFDMDEFKRTYCNNDVTTVGLPYFWDKFDAENYSIYKCTYKFPEQLRMVFMTNNLINGMYQRLEKLRKYAFGIMTIFGDNKSNNIHGLWVWRGTGLLFDVDTDFAIDSESYDWEKLNPKADSTKKMVKEYFTKSFGTDPADTPNVYK